MHDQAQTLRKLVQECVRQPEPPSHPAVLLVVGAKRGVGTTSLAAHLAVAFQQLQRATILIDASPSGGDLALVCRAEAGPSLAEIQAGHYTLAEALRPGPAGIQILGGPSPVETVLSARHDAMDPRWIGQLAQASPSTEVIVVDGGSGPNDSIEALWPVSHAVLLVLAPDPAAVVNGYAVLKLLRSAGDPLVYCLVNRAASAAAAGAVFGRIHRASRRFLGLEPRPAGFVPEDPMIGSMDAMAAPLVLGRRPAPARERLIRAACAVGEALHAETAEEFSVISCQERFNPEPNPDRYTRTLSVADQPLNFAD
jgi:flagellar biosynthesis protein FlhG